MSYSKLSLTRLIWGNLHTFDDTNIVFSFREKKNQIWHWQFSWVILDRKGFTSNDNKVRISCLLCKYRRPLDNKGLNYKCPLSQIFFFFLQWTPVLFPILRWELVDAEGRLQALSMPSYRRDWGICSLWYSQGPRSTPQWILRDNLVLEESEVRCGFLAVRGLSTPHPGVLGPTVYL